MIQLMEPHVSLQNWNMAVPPMPMFSVRAYSALTPKGMLLP